MTTVELAELVKEMRDAQKRYFRERTTEALAASKEIERRLDTAVAGILTVPAPVMPSLFDLIDNAD